jgi:hypothetical protein
MVPTRRDIMSKTSDDAIERLKGAASYLGHLSRAFLDTGNEHMHNELKRVSIDIFGHTGTLEHELHKLNDQRFRDAQQASNNVLGAVLGGIELSRRSEDVKTLAEYLTDDREEEDFREQLGEDAIVPMPGVDSDEWDQHLETWTETETGSYEDQDELRWLALHSSGHVYCSAMRLVQHDEEE